MSDAVIGEPGDRRGFIKTVGRLALAGVLGGGVAELIAGKGRRCETPSLCAQCAARDGCRLPAAVAFRGELRSPEPCVSPLPADERSTPDGSDEEQSPAHTGSAGPEATAGRRRI